MRNHLFFVASMLMLVAAWIGKSFAFLAIAIMFLVLGVVMKIKGS